MRKRRRNKEFQTMLRQGLVSMQDKHTWHKSRELKESQAGLELELGQQNLVFLYVKLVVQFGSRSLCCPFTSRSPPSSCSLASPRLSVTPCRRLRHLLCLILPHRLLFRSRQQHPPAQGRRLQTCQISPTARAAQGQGHRGVPPVHLADSLCCRSHQRRGAGAD
eukprot:754519-Hanusia_phi.AAC.4